MPQLQLLCMRPAIVCAAAPCCWVVTWAAVQLDHLAVACASLQPDLLSHSTCYCNIWDAE